jgi:hypothetical protein
MFLNLIAGAIYVGFGFSRMTNLKERAYKQKLQKAKRAIVTAENLEKEGRLLEALNSYLEAVVLLPKESTSKIDYYLNKATTLFERHTAILTMKNQYATTEEFMKILNKRKLNTNRLHIDYLLNVINKRDSVAMVKIFLKKTPEGQRFIHHIRKQERG